MLKSISFSQFAQFVHFIEAKIGTATQTASQNLSSGLACFYGLV